MKCFWIFHNWCEWGIEAVYNLKKTDGSPDGSNLIEVRSCQKCHKIERRKKRSHISGC